MPFGNEKKRHMTNTPPEIDKYDTNRTWCNTKMAHLVKKCPKVVFAKD